MQTAFFQENFENRLHKVQKYFSGSTKNFKEAGFFTDEWQPEAEEFSSVMGTNFLFLVELNY